MARKSFVELQAELQTLFPDNDQGEITPDRLWTFFTDIFHAIRPAYGILSRPNSALQVLTPAEAPLVFDTVELSDVPDFSGTAATGTILRLGKGTTRFAFGATLEAGSGREITVTLYKNGVATPWKATVNALGASRPVVFGFNGLDYEGVPATYQLRVDVDANTNANFSNMVFVAEVVPVNSYV